MAFIHLLTIVALIFAICLFVDVTSTTHKECFEDTFSVVDNVCVRWISCDPEQYDPTINGSLTYGNMKTENGTCKFLCKEGFYASGYVCSNICLGGTKLILNDTFCVKRCPMGYYITRNRWLSKCLICTVCEQCGLLYFKDRCVDRCPDGYVRLRNTCVDQCPFFIQENICIENCHASYFPQRDSKGQGFCSKCHPECATCYGPKDTECPICKNKREGNKCVPYCPRDIPIHSNHECLKRCHGIVINGTCFENCPNNQVKYKNTCVNRCPENDTVLFRNECLDECPPLFRKRPDKNDCIRRCPYQYPYEMNGRCYKECPRFKVNGECMQKCPPGYLTDLVEKSCDVSCPAMRPHILNTTCVIRCDEFLFGIACYERCPYNFPFVTRTCMKTCPALYPFKDPITNECVRRCPYKIFNGKCLKECSKPFTSKPGTSSCEKPCPSSKYFLDGECVEDCPAKVQTSTGQCVDKCPLGTYESENLCQDCHPFCSSDHRCSGPGSNQCEQCDLFFHNGECVSACPETSPYEAEDKQCVSQCPNGTFSNDVTYKCSSKCPEEFQYIYPDKKKCTQSCSPQIDEMLNPFHSHENMCMKMCKDGFPLPNGSCSSQCPQSFPLELKNRYGIKYCNNVCPLGTFILNAQSCVQICPDNHHIYIKNHTERYCLPGEQGHCVDYCNDHDCLSGILDRCTCSCMLSCPNGRYHLIKSETLTTCEPMAQSILKIISPLLVTILLIVLMILVCKYVICKRVSPPLVPFPSNVKDFLLKINEEATDTHSTENNMGL